jgi:multiple sugar transport system substrate-binding protein
MTGNKLSRRDFLRLSGASAALLASGLPMGRMLRAGALRQDKTTISFGGWGATGESKAVQDAIVQFEKENPTIHVEWDWTPDATADIYVQKFLTNVAAGTADDVFFVRSADYETFRKQGLLMDVTDRIKNDSLLGAKDYFFPQEAARCADDQGHWHGIGSCWVAPHLYYNVELLDKAGIKPPGFKDDEIWDWDTFVANAKKLTIDANGKHPDDSGFDVNNVKQWGVDWWVWWVHLYAMVAANGGTVTDPKDPTKLALDSPAAVEAIQRIADLINVHHVAPPHALQSTLGMSNSNMLNDGRIAMMVEGSWAVAWTNPTTMDKIKLGMGALPKMKQPATYMQAHFHSIQAATKHPEEAWKFLRFMNTPFYQTINMKIGLWLPSQTALSTDQAMADWLTKGIHPDNYKDFVKGYLPKYGYTFRVPAGYTEAEANFINPAFDAIANGQPAEKVMPTAIKSVNEVLAKAAK